MSYKNVGYMENVVVGRRNFYSGLPCQPWIWISMDISMCGYQT